MDYKQLKWVHAGALTSRELVLASGKLDHGLLPRGDDGQERQDYIGLEFSGRVCCLPPAT